MGQAGTTITDLKHQLIVLVTERDRVTATCNDLQSRLVQVEEENVKSLEAAEEKWKESVTSMEERNIALSQRLTAMEDEVKSNSPDSVCERETLVKCLEGERAAVLQLTDSLQAKELALTNAVDRYLQEKVMATTRKEELSVLRQRLREREEQMRALQSTIDSLQATRQVCVHVYICMYVFMYVYVYVCVYVYMCVCMYVCIYVCVCVCVLCTVCVYLVTLQGTGHTRKEHFLHSKVQQHCYCQLHCL